MLAQYKVSHNILRPGTGCVVRIETGLPQTRPMLARWIEQVRLGESCRQRVCDVLFTQLMGTSNLRYHSTQTSHVPSISINASMLMISHVNFQSSIYICRFKDKSTVKGPVTGRLTGSAGKHAGFSTAQNIRDKSMFDLIKAI